MRALPLLLFAAPSLVVLAACSGKADDKHGKSSVTIADGGRVAIATGDGDTNVAVSRSDGASTVSVTGDHGIKIDTDGFKAALDIPGMNIGGKDFDIDGMKLYPGSTVKGIAVRARETDGKKTGGATFTFTSPATPDAVLVHAEAQAKAADYTVTRSGLTLRGTKDGESSFVYTVAAAGAGTTGTVTMTDTKN